MFAGNTKQKEVVIMMDGRTQIHRGLDMAGTTVKPNKIKFNRINPVPHLSLKNFNCMTSVQEVEGSGLAATYIKKIKVGLVSSVLKPLI